MPLVPDPFATSGRWDASGLRALRSLLILHAGVRTLYWLAPTSSWIPGMLSIAMVATMRPGFIALVILSFWPRFGRRVAVIAAAAVFAQVAVSFPTVSDHVYLELFCLGLLALFDADDERDGPILRSTLCWMAVIVLFYGGLQKLLHGYYFYGELPLLAVAEKEAFGRLFTWALPAAEVDRLRGLNLSMPDAGPLRSDSDLLLMLSNAIWAAGIVLSAFIVFARSRPVGVVVAVVALLTFGGVARQPLFALLMAQLLVLCVPGEWNRRLTLPFAAVYVAVVAAAIVFGVDAVLPEGGR